MLHLTALKDSEGNVCRLGDELYVDPENGDIYRPISGLYDHTTGELNDVPGWHFDSDWITLCPIFCKVGAIHLGYHKDKVIKLKLTADQLNWNKTLLIT